MKKMNKKKTVILTICLLVVLSAIATILLAIYPVKIKVDREMEGMVFEYNYGEDTATPTYIRIKGTYRKYVFNWWHEDDFAGGIVVSDEPNIPDDIMDESYCHPYNYTEENFHGTGYDNKYKTVIDYYTMGELKPFFTEGMFIYDEDGFMCSIDIRGGYYAVFPATNTDELKENGKKINCLFNLIWE